ncbi:recombinase family protein [Arthrobacter bambusae]|uniref:recombinase family protein n=1 Tax=Arthrobacter bambusae TaxID=1338426 RepID=UPI00277F66CB|nr:recombinase family protein [Arthrobacter bambusae]MDQ0030132.1 DNA invertase Pin-like site-specific DNA recombinase [Arthrobacter bambusae]MDQ0097815.1 DNA invertase Pin-like site-specific DNA recombinase [Arthrobacter bambusae]
MSTTTAAIYARLSQDKRQGTSEEGSSVKSQIEACKRYISAQGWILGEIYQDNSISATTGAERPAFEKMIEDAPAVVVAFKQDRLSRSLMDTLRIKAAGITGHMCDGGRLDFSSADSEMLTVIRTAVDSAEGRKKAERQKLATLRDAKAGKYRGSIRPFGQKRTGEWVPAEAEAIREAAKRLAEEKQTFFKTAEIWNAAGLLTPATGKQGGKMWTSGTVLNFFTRPRLFGYQAYEGELYELKGWTPLLDEDTFNQIQTLIVKNRSGKRGVSGTRSDIHLLTNIARCIDCDRGMNTGQRGGPGSPRLYRCPTVKHQSVAAPPFEDAVSLHALDLLMHHDDSRQEAEEASNALAALMSEKRVAESEHDKWVGEAAVAGLRPSIIAKNEEAHRQRMTAMDDEILRLNRDMKVSIFQLPDTTVDRSTDMTERHLCGWRSVSIGQRRDLLKTLFERVTIERAGQGKRFDAQRISYIYTPLGRKLVDRWAEAEAEFLTLH